MANIIGVKFRCASKMYYFDPLEEVFETGERVIVETARGIEMGRVVVPNREIDDEELTSPLKPIIRKATEKDLENEKINKAKEPEAFRICREKIKNHELEMKLVTVEYTFDGSKVLFYFTADGRVDFRELVKDLASTFRTRIELRQIGVRDEAKIKGGIGICGRPLCCTSYLSDFVPVSIKMAKEQNLSLNPTKISGCCGRLMCCLKNEEETYEELNSRLPSLGDAVTVRGERTKGTVQSVNVLRQKVRVLVNSSDGDTEVKEYGVEELLFEKGRRTFPAEEEPEELRELEELEEKEEVEHQEGNGSRREDKNRRNRGDRRDRANNERRDSDQRGGRDRRQRRPRPDETDEKKNDGASAESGEPQNRSEGAEDQPAERRDRRDRQRRNDKRNRREDQPREGKAPEIAVQEGGQAKEERDDQPRRDGHGRKNRPPRQRDGAPLEGARQENRETVTTEPGEEGAKQKRPYRNHDHRRRPHRGPGNGPTAGTDA